YILLRQVERGGYGIGEDGDHLGMADAAVQGLHGQDHIGRDLDEIVHILVFVREALRDLLAVLEGILDADDLVGLDALPPAFDVNLIEIPSDVILPVEALDGSIGHSKMVAIFAYAIATSFNLPEKDKLDILHAG